MPIRLGNVGHFSLAVRNPKKSARWWVGTMGLKKEFEFSDGVVVGNDAVAIALFKGAPRQDVMAHVVSHFEHGRVAFGARGASPQESQNGRSGEEIGPEGPGSKTWIVAARSGRLPLGAAVLAKPPKKSKKRKRAKTLVAQRSCRAPAR